MAKKVDKLSNFLPINRRFFQHPLWKEERMFSKAEAWLWLIAEARFDAAVANELIGGKTVRWVRGELPASLRYLAEAWNWEKNQVDRFLKLLETEAMILRRLDKGQTIIRLINYSTHNGQNEMGHLNSSPASVSGESRDSEPKIKNSKIKMGQQMGQTFTSLPTVSEDEWDSKRDSGFVDLGQQMGQQMGQTFTSLPTVSEDEWDSKRDSKWDRGVTRVGQGRDKTNIDNIENKEKKREIHASSDHSHSAETIQLFEGFKSWIAKNAPRVNQMKEPISIDQFVQLRDKLNKDLVRNLLMDMHNWEPLIKKNRSAYLTLLKWKKLDSERNPTPHQVDDLKKMVL